MLGNCLVRNPRTLTNKFDKGAVCEALLFYDGAHFVLDYGALANLVNANFLEETIELIKEGHATANYSPEFTALYTDNKFGLKEHNFALIKAAGIDPNRKLSNAEMLEFQLSRLLSDRSQVRKYYRELTKLISFKDYRDDRLASLAKTDILDPQFRRFLAVLSLRNFGIPENEINFNQLDVLDLGSFKFAIATDINFAALAKYVPEDSRGTFSQNDIFAGLIDARLDIYLAAQHNASLIGNEKNNLIIDHLLRRYIGTSGHLKTTVGSVYEFVEVGTPTIREVINAGERSPKEFLRLLKDASIFRKWIKKQNPDANLVKEMLKEKTAIAWFSTLPAKIMRFALFGIVPEVFAPSGGGLALGAIDAFLVDKILERWRPHYFIENQLKGFLDVEVKK
jgi:hypothetical protein